MELRVYDTELVPEGVVDEVNSLLWTPTYWQEGTVGDIKLLVPMTENNKRLLQKGAIVVKHDGAPDYVDGQGGKWRRATQLQYRHITKDVEGAEQIEVWGCFLKRWLSKRVVLDNIVMTDTEQGIINKIVAKNHGNEAAAYRKLPRFVVLPQEDLGGSAVEYANENLVDAGKEIYTRALAGKLGYDILVNEEDRLYGFYLYKGKDLTSTNTAGETPCIFSRDFDNVNEQEYTESMEGAKNVIYASGAANDAGVQPVIEVNPNEAEGLERDEVYVDMSGIARTYREGEVEITIPESTYLEMLAAAARAELDNYAETVSFTATINVSSNLQYGVDFKVGDRVTCIEKNWGIRIDVRITAVCETYQDNTKELEATLGDSLPTLIQQIRKVR